MSTKEVAQKFAEYCKVDNTKKVMEMYSDDIISIEEGESPMQICKGKEAIQAKIDWWNNTYEDLGTSCSGPFHNADQFSLIFDMKTKHKETGEIEEMKEVAVYTVKEGKVVEEKFMY
jgi:ketosteroid isomerase-like protein